jgi:hypothetical protein
MVRRFREAPDDSIEPILLLFVGAALPRTLSFPWRFSRVVGNALTALDDPDSQRGREADGPQMCRLG